jgi:hypothetical protein
MRQGRGVAMTMKTALSLLGLSLLLVTPASAQVSQFPSNGAVDVSPDTRLKLMFASAPVMNNQGKVRIYDAADNSVVDELDMSIPPGPRNTRTPAPYDTFKYSSVPDTVFTVNSPDTDKSHVYQQNLVGDTSESSARHFFPILIDANTATITPHNNRLAYGKTYYVEVEASIFPQADNSFSGKASWSFSTKGAPPSTGTKRVVVAADGTGDFNSVQGAIDWVPNNDPTAREIFIKRGIYEEIVVVRNKQNLTLVGEDRKDVLVRYANNGVFNSVGRYELTLSGSNAVNLLNFTIQVVGKDENPAQAEALYVKGDKYQVHEVSMLGSGDALQIQAETRIFLSGSTVRGYGDNFLSYWAAFFKRCNLISTYGPHGWPRNPQTNHGDVFIDSTFTLEGKGTSGDGHCTLARSPTSGVSFPYAEFVLINCKLQGIAPEGWGAVGPDTTNVHFWEYNSVNLSDGKPVDVSKRVPYSRQLTLEKDAETIANYSDPGYVLAGWVPELAPVILQPLPATLAIPVGASLELTTHAAAEPEPTFQWHKDGQALPGETQSSLKLAAATAANAGEYTVTVTNNAGTTSSKSVVVVGSAGTSMTNAGAAGASAATSGTLGAQAGSLATTTTTLTTTQGGAAGAVSSAAPARGGAPKTGSAGAAPTGAATLPPNAQAGTGTPAATDGNAPGQNPSAAGGGCSVGAPAAAAPSWPVLLLGALVVRRSCRRRARSA